MTDNGGHAEIVAQASTVFEDYALSIESGVAFNIAADAVLVLVNCNITLGPGAVLCTGNGHLVLVRTWLNGVLSTGVYRHGCAAPLANTIPAQSIPATPDEAFGGAAEIIYRNGNAAITVALQQGEMVSAWRASVRLVYAASDEFTPEMEKFAQALRECFTEGTTMTLEGDGRSFYGVVVAEFTSEFY